MTITSRHDNSATILAKVRTIVTQRKVWTRECTDFDMGQQAAYDTIRETIEAMEKRIDTTSNS